MKPSVKNRFPFTDTSRSCFWRRLRLKLAKLCCPAVVGLANGLLGGCCSTHPTVHTIPNFAVVNGETKVYRGGEPVTGEAWAYLKSLGVRTVVKLNEESESKDTGAAVIGLRVVRLPISTVEQTIGSPNVATIRRAVDEMSHGAVFVHCGSNSRSNPHSFAAKTHSQGGQDRTGLVVATYRVWVQRWTKQDAHAEMMSFGFHPMLPGLANFWRDEVK